MSCKATYIGCMHSVYCNLPPELLAEWLGSFMCYRGNMREERILKSVSTKSWPWRRKLPPLHLGLKPQTFQSWVRSSNHWAIHAPCAPECMQMLVTHHIYKSKTEHMHTLPYTEDIYIYTQTLRKQYTGCKWSYWLVKSITNEWRNCLHSCTQIYIYIYIYIHTHHYMLHSSQKLLWSKLYMHEITL